jgi:hypothetical protein
MMLPELRASMSGKKARHSRTLRVVNSQSGGGRAGCTIKVIAYVVILSSSHKDSYSNCDSNRTRS